MSAKNKLSSPTWWQRWKKAGAVTTTPRRFSLAVVLSVVTRRHLSSDLNEEYELASFLTGNYSVPIPGNEAIYELARDEMARQYSQLWDGQMQFAMGELILSLERTSEADIPYLILGWLKKQELRLATSEFTFGYVHKPARP